MTHVLLFPERCFYPSLRLLLFPARCVSRLPPVKGEAAGLCRLQQEDPRPLHAAGVGQVLARGLPEVRLLRLPPGTAGLHPLHPGQPHPLPQGLPEVTPLQVYLD